MQIHIQVTSPVSDNGTIILYDFGMVGRLDNDTRKKLIRLYLGLIDKDPVGSTDVLRGRNS